VTRSFVEYLRRRLHVPSISDDLAIQAAWEKLTERRDEAGRWVGSLERLVFFSALLLGTTKANEAVAAIGVWLAFKVAAKWESWNHMAYVPESVPGVDDPLRYALARRIWAAHGYATFVMGTGMNFVVAAACAALTYLSWMWLC
jgi:hypothetical protein